MKSLPLKKFIQIKIHPNEKVCLNEKLTKIENSTQFKSLNKCKDYWKWKFNPKKDFYAN